MCRLRVHGVSEILAVVLLSAIVAALGFFIVYNVLQMSSLITHAATSKRCYFVIAAVPLNKTSTSITLTPIVYNSGEVPCKIVSAYVIEKSRVIVRKSLNSIVLPGQMKIVGSINVNLTDVTSGVLVVRLVSSDGTIQDYIVRISV